MSKRLGDLKRLAGSPWVDLAPPRPRGRPRKFATNDSAARKRASRAAKKLKDEAAALEKDRLAQIAALKHEQIIDNESATGGSLLLTDADRGKGKIASGGYNTQQIDNVDSARERDGVTNEDVRIESGGSGRKVSAPGHGIDEDESSDDDAAPAGGWKKPTGQQPSEKTNTWFGFIICKLHGVVDGPCQSFKIKSRGNGRGIPKTFFVVPGKESFEEDGTWYLPLPAHRKKGAWRLSCGCARPVLKNIIVTIVTEQVEELDDTEVDENTLLIDTLRRKWKSESYKGETIPR